MQLFTGMTLGEAIWQLELLREHCKSMIRGTSEDDTWMEYMRALNLAIAVLRGKKQP